MKGNEDKRLQKNYYYNVLGRYLTISEYFFNFAFTKTDINKRRLNKSTKDLSLFFFKISLKKISLVIYVCIYI